MAVDRRSLSFADLAGPARGASHARLGKGGASVTQLEEPFDMSLPAVSRHRKVLERAGLVTRGREAQWRPCALEAGPLKESDEGGEGLSRILGPRAAQVGGETNITKGKVRN